MVGGNGNYGRALYQLHLVKAATARAFVPRELRLVEAFGYTLGGMFLARYDDSPPASSTRSRLAFSFSGDLSLSRSVNFLIGFLAVSPCSSW